MNRRPIDCMTRKERETYLGEWKDLDEERKVFAREYKDEQTVAALYDLIVGILSVYNQKGTIHLAQVVVCNPMYRGLVDVIARQFSLVPVFDPRMPLGEIFVSKYSDIEKMVINRMAKKLEKNGKSLILDRYGEPLPTSSNAILAMPLKEQQETQRFIQTAQKQFKRKQNEK